MEEEDNVSRANAQQLWSSFCSTRIDINLTNEAKSKARSQPDIEDTASS